MPLSTLRRYVTSPLWLTMIDKSFIRNSFLERTLGFVGRTRELVELTAHLDVIRSGRRADRGVAVLLRGRRRVGKSRLATELVERTGLPHVYFQAARRAPAARELADLADAVATSSLPDAAVARDTRPQTLTAALTTLATALPDDSPSIVVLDEAPWLLEGFDGGPGELQRVWDTRLSRKPVLLLLLGSDMSAMEQLTAPDQPFHGRAIEMVLRVLTPAEVATMTGTSGMDAFDAHLITGGQPLVAQEWENGMSMGDFLRDSYGRATSALLVSGTRVLDGELGADSIDRAVLTAVGGRGERTFTKIQQATGPTPYTAAALSAALSRLQWARILAADEPLSTRATSKLRRFRLADPALRYWLAFVEPSLSDVDRGRPDLATARHAASYRSWRGRAVEPIVRESLSRLLPDETWPAAREIGGWWSRSNTPEIDLVGADHRPADNIAFVGTVKWRPDRPVSARDARALAVDANAVPGVGPETPLVAVCPAGTEEGAGFAATWIADDLLRAWPG